MSPRLAFSKLRDRYRSLIPKTERSRTPTILQMEAVECGAAALAMVLAYYGTYIPLEELRVACGVSRDGSKASNVIKAARRYGLVAKGFRKRPSSLRKLNYPAILHWNFNHFVVLEGFRGDKVFINDPALGPLTVTAQELDEAFTGVVLTFKPDETFQKQGRKPSLLKALRQRLQRSEVALAFVLLVSLALVIPGLVIPAFSRIFVDFYLVRGQSQWLLPLFAGMLLTALLRACLTWLQQRYLLRLELKLSISSAGQLFHHILRLPIEFFSQRSAGDISARIEQNDRVAQLLSGQLTTTVINIFMLVFYALLMIRYSVTLTLIGIGMACLNFIALQAVSRKRKDTNRRMIEAQGKLISTTYGSLQQIETIKSTGGEPDAFTKWAGYQAKTVNAYQELGAATQVLNVVPLLLSYMTTVLILTIGGYLIVAGDMTVGMLVAFQSLMTGFLAPVGQLVNLGGQVQEIEGIINRLNDVLNYPIDPQAELANWSEDVELKRLSGAFEIRDLTFGYSKLAPPLVEEFNLKLEPGQRVALVGGSGSGKSTIARLVAGLYQPWRGSILFDGLERHDIPRIVLNNSLRMVDQEIFLFDSTIQDNLTMWDSSILEEKVLAAAKDAAVHDVIASRADGYRALIEEDGRNFSGGQRQRMEIARALVTNPSLLILDEATSALDPLTEQIIDDNLRRRGCACLIIAHRLSTIRDCDEIVVLDKGRVIERGTHEQLWRKGGAYTKLIRADTPESELVMDTIWESLAA